MAGDTGGFYASLEDPRYSESVNRGRAPVGIAPADLAELAPARTGAIWGALFRSPTNYTRFTGGLAQFAEDGCTVHTLAPIVKPYSYAGVSPTMAWENGFGTWRPKLSAFVNRALGAANAGRTPATRVEGPSNPERGFAIPKTAFWPQLPANTEPWFNRQPGYVTRWPTTIMSYKQMGPNGGQGV